MRKLIKTALALCCSVMFIFALAGCGGSGNGAPASGASTPAASGSQENPVKNSYSQVELDRGIYYVEVFTPESDPGDNPSALDGENDR